MILLSLLVATIHGAFMPMFEMQPKEMPEPMELPEPIEMEMPEPMEYGDYSAYPYMNQYIQQQNLPFIQQQIDLSALFPQQQISGFPTGLSGQGMYMGFEEYPDDCNEWKTPESCRGKTHDQKYCGWDYLADIPQCNSLEDLSSYCQTLVDPDTTKSDKDRGAQCAANPGCIYLEYCTSCLYHEDLIGDQKMPRACIPGAAAGLAANIPGMAAGLANIPGITAGLPQLFGQNGIFSVSPAATTTGTTTTTTTGTGSSTASNTGSSTASTGTSTSTTTSSSSSSSSSSSGGTAGTQTITLPNQITGPMNLLLPDGQVVTITPSSVVSTDDAPEIETETRLSKPRHTRFDIQDAMMLQGLMGGSSTAGNQAVASTTPCFFKHPETDYLLPCSTNGVVYTQLGEMDAPIKIDTNSGTVTGFNPFLNPADLSAYGNVGTGALGAGVLSGELIEGDIAEALGVGALGGYGGLAGLGGLGGGVFNPSIQAQIANLDNVDGDAATQMATANIMAQIAALNQANAAAAAGTGTTTAGTGTTTTATDGDATSTGTTTPTDGVATSTGTTTATGTTATGTGTANTAATPVAATGIHPMALAALTGEGDIEDLIGLGALGGLGGVPATGGINPALLALGGDGNALTAQVLSQGPNASWLTPKLSYGEAIDGDVREDMQKIATGQMLGFGGLAGIPSLQKAAPAAPTKPQSTTEHPFQNPWFWAFLVNCVIISSGVTFFYLSEKNTKNTSGYTMYLEEQTEQV